MTIDAHFHLWRLDRPECRWPTAAEAAIHRDYGIADFAAVAGPLGVGAGVLVQSQEAAADTEWLLELARGDDRIAAVVGWTDFLADDAPARIAALAARPKLAGLRPMVQDRAADWYDEPECDPALRAMAEHSLVLDALIRPQHLPALDRLAARHPQLRIVIDHAAKPPIGKPDAFADWRAAIAPLAAREHGYCKLSGLLTECDEPSAAAVAPYVEALLQLFGPGRLVWGSDWPVVEVVSSYEAWLAMARAMVPERFHHAVFAGNARRLYGLGEAS